jgi:UDP-GlcNAc:undecaprenyl-phosphate/decaprenyl-phosphate GlcNAc-1-phosphate transferase
MIYLLPFLISFALSLLVTPVVRRLALRHGIIDHPTGGRKIHDRPIAYLGGVAIFTGFLLPVIYYLPFSRRLGALLLGISLLLVIGVIDDIRGMKAWKKLIWQFVAAGIVLAGGIGITSLTNPFGGQILLDWGRFAVDFGPLHFNITPIGNLLSLLWMVGVINVINFLDGLDGLACGVSAISGLTIFLLSIKPDVDQPVTALLAIVLTGAALGFLPYNFFPARIFMGDGGAYFLGLTLALLAIYSGGKLATAGLVLGFTIFDGLLVAVRRMYHRTSPFTADRQHFHHLLMAAGLSHRGAVLTLYLVATMFGLLAVYAGSFVKLIGLVVLFALLAVTTALLRSVAARREQAQSKS